VVFSGGGATLLALLLAVVAAQPHACWHGSAAQALRPQPAGELVWIGAGDGDQQRLPVVAAGAGGFLVVWVDGEEQTRLRARALTSSGAAAGDIITISEDPGRKQMPGLVADRAGELLVVWTVSDSDGSTLRVRQLGSDGTPYGPQEVVAITSCGGEDDICYIFDCARVVSPGPGSYFVAYSIKGAGCCGSRALRYSEGRLLPSGWAWRQYDSTSVRVGSAGAGSLLVAWHDLGQQAIVGERYDGYGNLLGDRIALLSDSDHPDGAEWSLAVLSAGKLVLMWSASAGSTGHELWARVFDPEMTSPEAPFLVSGATIHDGSAPLLVTNDWDDIVAVWRGRTATGQRLYGRQLEPSGPLAGEIFEIAGLAEDESTF
jgi:hypothetical protein